MLSIADIQEPIYQTVVSLGEQSHDDGVVLQRANQTAVSHGHIDHPDQQGVARRGSLPLGLGLVERRQ